MLHPKVRFVQELWKRKERPKKVSAAHKVSCSAAVDVDVDVEPTM